MSESSKEKIDCLTNTYARTYVSAHSLKPSKQRTERCECELRVSMFLRLSVRNNNKCFPPIGRSLCFCLASSNLACGHILNKCKTTPTTCLLTYLYVVYAHIFVVHLDLLQQKAKDFPFRRRDELHKQELEKLVC